MSEEKKQEKNFYPMYTDMRVIDMLRQPKAVNTERLKGCADWLSLGCFNQFSVEKLDTGTKTDKTKIDLFRIYQHNQKLSQKNGDSYSQPIYLLQEFLTANKKAVEAFWTSISSFLLVSRVHATLTGQQEFEDAIDACLRLKSDEDRIQPVPYDCISFDEGPIGSGVKYICYRTLEFSDVILVAKSDSIETLMKVIGRLYGLPCVGDCYSYIGIAPMELSEARKHYAVQNDEIPYAVMRFAVKSAKKTREFFEMFKQKLPEYIRDKFMYPLLVTGTEDVKILVRNISSAALCEVLYDLLPNSEPSRIAETSAFWEAFDYMTTRLSIDESALFQSPGVPKATDPDLHSCYCELNARIQRLYSLAGNSFPDWLRPTAELVKLMQKFSGDCIYFQVCYTVLDGVKGLVRLCEKAIIVDQADPANKAIIDMLHMMLTGISDLIEHMIRMEGELVHHPESRPILYDIPANLLELYLHFSDSCMTYFRNREIPAFGKKCRLLVVPCLCSTIKIKNITDYVDKEPSILYVEIPLHLLYESKYAICSLVHEVAHFSGELTRKREARYKNFVFGIASLLATYLDMPDSMVVFEELVKKIGNMIPNDTRTYMDDLHREVIKAVDEICTDRQYIHNLTYLYFSDIGKQADWEAKYVKAAKNNLSTKKINDFRQDIEEIAYLFRETYADLAMVSLLKLSAEDYLSMIKRDIRLKGETIFPLAVERAAVVIHTAQKMWAVNGKCVDTFDETVKDYLNWLDNHHGIKFRDSFHSFEVVRPIAMYLKECNNAIDLYDISQENVDQLSIIRKEFTDFADKQKFASLEFYDALAVHRKSLISSLET